MLEGCQMYRQYEHQCGLPQASTSVDYADMFGGDVVLGNRGPHLVCKPLLNAGVFYFHLLAALSEVQFWHYLCMNIKQ